MEYTPRISSIQVPNKANSRQLKPSQPHQQKIFDSIERIDIVSDDQKSISIPLSSGFHSR